MKKKSKYIAQTGLKSPKPFQQSDTFATNAQEDNILSQVQTPNAMTPEQYAFLKQYTQAGYQLNNYNDGAMAFERETGNIDFHPAFQVGNALAQGATAIGNKVSDVNIRRREIQDMIRAMQPTSYENYNEAGLNNLPVYTQNGGQVPRQNVEAEQGEVLQYQDGTIDKVPDNGRRHEQGGVLVDNVDRVLEDTSDKRKDATSKALKITPELAKLMTGYEPKSDISHSKLFEKASEHHIKTLRKYEKAIERSVDTVDKIPSHVYAKNSMNLNMKQLDKLPTEGEIFDQLFDHQEFVKGMLGVAAPKAQYGGKYEIAQNGLKNYTGAKTKGGRYTPTGADVNDLSGTVTLEDYIAAWSKEGVDLSGVTSVKEAQSRTYDYLLEKSPNVLREMWKAFGNTNQGKTNKILTDRFPTGNFGDTELTLEDLKSLKGGYADDMFAIRRLIPGSDETVETTPAPAATPEAPKEAQPMNPLNIKLRQNPQSRFNEPLRWFDAAGPIDALLSSGRIGAKYNPVELNQLRLKQQNPLPTLQNAQTDYNAVVGGLPNNSLGMANTANVFSKKYAMDNQVLGQYENINNQIKNQEIQYNTGVRDRQSAANAQARSTFETQYLGGMEAQRQQKLDAMDDLYTRVALNRKLNREGNLLMKLYPAFDQYAEFNGYELPLRNPINVPPTGVAPTGTQSTRKTQTKYVTLSNGKKVPMQ